MGEWRWCSGRGNKKRRPSAQKSNPNHKGDRRRSIRLSRHLSWWNARHGRSFESGNSKWTCWRLPEHSMCFNRSLLWIGVRCRTWSPLVRHSQIPSEMWKLKLQKDRWYCSLKRLEGALWTYWWWKVTQCSALDLHSESRSWTESNFRGLVAEKRKIFCFLPMSRRRLLQHCRHEGKVDVMLDAIFSK